MKELKTELFESINANGERVRNALEQQIYESEYVDTKKDNLFLIVLIAFVCVGAFAWWFI